VPAGQRAVIGALFGPGLLLRPGLARKGGTASLIAGLALLGLSAISPWVFAALGAVRRAGGGADGYRRGRLGRRAEAMTGGGFLAGVIAGAPIRLPHGDS